MIVEPTAVLWGRQTIDDIIDDIFGDGSSSSTTSTSRSSTSLSTSSSTSTTSRTTTSSSSTTTLSSTTSSTTTSSTSSIITTSSPTTLTTTSASLSGTSTFNVVITQTRSTPVVTTAVRPVSINSSGGTNGALIGGMVGGVVGGLALIALLVAICITSSRRRSRTGHAYFLCFGTRPSKAEKGELGHSGGAWPTFDPNDEHSGAGYGLAAAGGAAASSRRRRRREQTHATLPPGFANDEDPETYGVPESSGGHEAFSNDYSQSHHDAYSGGYSQNHASAEMHERMGVGALAAAGGAYYTGNRRSSHGQYSYGSNDALNNMPPGASSPSQEQIPAPWNLPMLGRWNGADRGPYLAAGVGHAPPQAFHMMGPGEGFHMMAAAAATPDNGRSRPSGPDYSHFDPPEVRDARAREAVAAALSSGTYSSHPPSLTPGPTSPRQRANRRLSDNNGSPSAEHSGLAGPSPPAYVDANEDIEEMGAAPARRLYLTNAEPEATDDESSRGGPTRPSHNHGGKDGPPSSTYRPN